MPPIGRKHCILGLPVNEYPTCKEVHENYQSGKWRFNKNTIFSFFLKTSHTPELLCTNLNRTLICFDFTLLLLSYVYRLAITN